VGVGQFASFTTMPSLITSSTDSSSLTFGRPTVGWEHEEIRLA